MADLEAIEAQAVKAAVDERICCEHPRTEAVVGGGSGGQGAVECGKCTGCVTRAVLCERIPQLTAETRELRGVLRELYLCVRNRSSCVACGALSFSAHGRDCAMERARRLFEEH